MLYKFAVSKLWENDVYCKDTTIVGDYLPLADFTYSVFNTGNIVYKRFGKFNNYNFNVIVE